MRAADAAQDGRGEDRQQQDETELRGELRLQREQAARGRGQPPPMIQVQRRVAATSMPLARARSALSAVARIAVPNLVR